jgi:hypothetical protein
VEEGCGNVPGVDDYMPVIAERTGENIGITVIVASLPSVGVQIINQSHFHLNAYILSVSY